MLKDPTQISPDRLGRGFIIKLADINTTKRSGICDACGEDIDVTDGAKFIRVQLRTEGFQLRFHVGCFEHIFSGMEKFSKTFLETRNDPKPN